MITKKNNEETQVKCNRANNMTNKGAFHKTLIEIYLPTCDKKNEAVQLFTIVYEIR